MKRNRENLSPEDRKRKELVRELLRLNPIKEGNIQNLQYHGDLTGLI